MKPWMLLLPVCAALGLLVAQGPAKGPASVTVTGCVSTEGPLEAAVLQGLPRVHRHVKVAEADGSYRCSLEVEGVALKDLLEGRGVKKKVDDGFTRPLDLVVTVTGRGGRKATLSYSEVFLAGHQGPLLAEKARFILPHHHKPLKDISVDPTRFLGIPERGRLELTSCADCHDGKTQRKLSMPAGWLLVLPEDRFGGRFVEEVSEIALQQVGTSVKDTREAAKALVQETPEIVKADGTRLPLRRDQFQKRPRHTWTDATYGLGRGFHGIRTWEGTDLAGLLRPLLPAGVDPLNVYVLVTAADGYRVVYSGGEIFQARDGAGVWLVDRIDGQPMGPGSGRYHTVSRADFYIDRDVRQVKEVRIIPAP